VELSDRGQEDQKRGVRHEVERRGQQSDALPTALSLFVAIPDLLAVR
jgi:hypothetical protein